MPLSQMGALRVLNRSAWEKKIRTAMFNAEGRIPDAAIALAVGARQLFRWLEDETFTDVVRVENGLPRDGNKRGRKKGQLHTEETKEKMRLAWSKRSASGKKDKVMPTRKKKVIPTRAERVAKKSAA